MNGGVSVRAEFVYVPDRGRRLPVCVELGWFPDDPHAVSLWFARQDNKQWTCGRELLFEALTSDAAGEGDVRFWCSEFADYVAMALDSPSGHAGFTCRVRR